MPRSSDPTRKRILEGAYRLFRRQGYSRVTMDGIAATAGLTKRSLYQHFESKDQLLADVLEAQDDLALQAFRTFGDKLSGSPGWVGAIGTPMHAAGRRCTPIGLRCLLSSLGSANESACIGGHRRASASQLFPTPLPADHCPTIDA